MELSFRLIKVGSWNKNYGTNFTRNFTEAYSELVDSLGNKTLIITTILVRVSALYRVFHLLIDLGWVDLEFEAPPCCLVVKRLLPNFHPHGQTIRKIKFKYNMPGNGSRSFENPSAAPRPASVCLASISAKIITNTPNRVQTINGYTVDPTQVS